MLVESRGQVQTLGVHFLVITTQKLWPDYQQIAVLLPFRTASPPRGGKTQTARFEDLAVITFFLGFAVDRMTTDGDRLASLERLIFITYTIRTAPFLVKLACSR